MEVTALTDFSVAPIDAHNQCRCGSVARIKAGLCVNCLLQDGLEGIQLSDDAFSVALSEIDIPDRDWRLGRYHILEEIGRGGMGVIYRARHLPSQRIVAVKRVLTYHSDSQATLARFHREAAAAASLDHPNILPIYDVGTTADGLPYFSMKFATGGSLLNARNLFRSCPRQCAQLMAKIARAVQHAHEQGVIHRDLKPGNILLDRRGEPMVADFGLAKWLDSNSDLTCTLTVFGTPGYIAPEQAQGTHAGHSPAVDVYSVGAIFFELLGGRPPFLGEHALGVIRQASERPAPKLRSIASSVPKDLEIICARCLERDPRQRYQTAAELASDIERWLDDRPILARRISLPVRLWRWARRNSALALSLTTCLALASIAVAWQIDNWRLGKTIRGEEMATHSVAVLPFLDLDEGTADYRLSGRIADTLRTGMGTVGPAKVINLSDPFPAWTGTGTSNEIAAALKSTSCQAALTGVFRHAAGGIRLSLRAYTRESENPTASWLIKIPRDDALAEVLGQHDFSASLYGLVNRAKDASRKVDPVMADPTARDYFSAGRALLDRRTLSDADHAVSCFESAVRAAPRSALARSYLALAYMGRNFLSADPKYINRAYTVAKEALQLSPNDSSAHRALCGLDNFTGRLEEALEHGLAALEYGDPSERALGQVAYIWEQLGRPDKAIQWFQKAKASDKQRADYDAILGDAWMLLGKDEEAREAYRSSLNFRPDLPEGWLGLCHLKLIEGEFDQARVLFAQRASEYAAFHTTEGFAAHLEFFARNYAEAERLYGDLLKADPEGVGTQQYGAISSMAALARVKIGNGDIAAGKQLLETCLTNDRAQLIASPRNPEVLYRLAADEAMQGDNVAAVNHFKASIAAGFLDYRSARMDPRFDALAGTSQFQDLLSQLAAHVATLRGRLQSVNTPKPNQYHE